jgi:AsmA protein
MKREDQRQQRRLLTFALLSLFLLAVLAPLFLVVDPIENVLRGSSVKAADQGSFVLSRPLFISKIPGLTVRSGAISLAKAPNATPAGSRARAELLKSGRSVLILDHPRLQISAGRENQSYQNSEAPFAKALAEMNFRALLIEGGDLTIETESGPSINIKDLNLRLRPIAGGRMIAKGSFTFVGQKLRFDTTIGLSDANLASKKIPVRGTVDAGNLLTAAFNGYFAVGSGGRLTSNATRVDVKDVPEVARWLGLSWPAELALQRFKASGKMEWVGQVLNFPSGEFELDSNSATGSLLLNTKGERPLVDGTLAFESFDLGAIVAKGPDGNPPSEEPVKSSRSPTFLSAGFKRMLHHFRLPILQQIDVDLRVSSGSTVFGEMRLGRTAAALSLHNGRILADLAEIEFPAAGRGNLQFTADTSRAVVHCSLRGSLEQVPLEKISSLLLPAPVFSGSANVRLDLNGSWARNDEFLRGLNGRTSIRMDSGAVLSANLPGLIQSVGIDRPAQLGWGEALTVNTPLDGLNADIVFKNGIANFEEFQVRRRGYYSADASGSLNIFGKSLDLNIFPKFDNANADQPSVLNINGHWNNPILVRRRYPHKAEKPGRSQSSPPRNTAPAIRPLPTSNRG